MNKIVTSVFFIIIAYTHTSLCMDKLYKKQHPLIIAIRKKNFDQCKTIIEENPNIVDTWHMPYVGDICTPLHIAVDTNNIPVAHLLLTSNASINSKTQNSLYTPLHVVRSKEMVQLLLEHGANINERDHEEKTPLYHVLFNYYCYFFKYGDSFCKEFPSDDERYSCAHHLVKKGADINILDYKGYSLLHTAVKEFHSDAITFLLEHSANPDIRDSKDKTPLEKARSRDLTNFEEFNVIDRVIASNEPYWDPFYILKDDARFFKEVRNNSIGRKHEIVKFLAHLLMKAERNNNNYFSGDNAILYRKQPYGKEISFADWENYVGKNSIDYIKNYVSNKCQKALSIAKNCDYKKLKKIANRYSFVLTYDKKVTFDLLKHIIICGNPKTFAHLLHEKPDLSGVDEHGNTLLHIAIAHSNAKAITKLIKNNISLTTHNNYQKTPLDALDAIDDKNCIDAFNNAFINKFFLTGSYETFYREIKKFLKTECNNAGDKSSNLLLLKKLLLFQAATHHPEKCSILLKNGATVTQETIDCIHDKYVRMMLQEKLSNWDLFFKKHPEVKQIQHTK